MPNNSDANASATKDKLVEDVKVLTKDVQDLLKVTASLVGEKASDARVRLESGLKVAHEKFGTVRETAKAKGMEVAGNTDEYVRGNPWNAVGIAAGLGLLVGLVIAASSFSGRDE